MSVRKNSNASSATPRNNTAQNPSQSTKEGRGATTTLLRPPFHHRQETATRCGPSEGGRPLGSFDFPFEFRLIKQGIFWRNGYPSGFRSNSFVKTDGAPHVAHTPSHLWGLYGRKKGKFCGRRCQHGLQWWAGKARTPLPWVEDRVKKAPGPGHHSQSEGMKAGEGRSVENVTPAGPHDLATLLQFKIYLAPSTTNGLTLVAPSSRVNA
jgi:hypothetical protein